jgi:hypothetical protein
VRKLEQDYSVLTLPPLRSTPRQTSCRTTTRSRATHTNITFSYVYSLKNICRALSDFISWWHTGYHMHGKNKHCLLYKEKKKNTKEDKMKKHAENNWICIYRYKYILTSAVFYPYPTFQV